MRQENRIFAVLALGATFAVGACGRSHDESRATTSGGDIATPATTSSASAPVSSTPVDTAPAKHHSKLVGALAGAAAGHMLGGHAVAGAAAGALIQHERNKHHR
jgi:hypothetical protein